MCVCIYNAPRSPPLRSPTVSSNELSSSSALLGSTIYMHV